MRRQGAFYGGVYPNTNDGFAYATPPITTEHFIVGDFIVVDSVNSSLRFDERMTLKEDYDFTCQHLHTHGQVCRINRIFVGAEHYTNKGGAVAVRTTEREAANIAHLRAKWPGVFINQKRENEVILRWQFHKQKEDEEDSEDESAPVEKKKKKKKKNKDDSGEPGAKKRPGKRAKRS